MKNSQGYILLWVLCCLQLLSAISLYQLQRLSVFTKSTQYHQLSQQLHRVTQQSLAELEADFSLIPPACFVGISPVTWLDRLNEVGCKGEYKEYSYLFFVEFLGSNDCDFIDINQGVTADYYRITLKLLPATNGLQSIVVIPRYLASKCLGARHQIRMGRQVWREIYKG